MQPRTVSSPLSSSTPRRRTARRKLGEMFAFIFIIFMLHGLVRHMPENLDTVLADAGITGDSSIVLGSEMATQVKERSPDAVVKETPPLEETSRNDVKDVIQEEVPEVVKPNDEEDASQEKTPEAVVLNDGKEISQNGDGAQPNDSVEIKSDRPFALIHAGPMKTGSTTIQHGFQRNQKQLLEDNFVYFSRTKTWDINVWFRRNKGDVEKRWTECPEWKEFMEFMAKAKSEGRNVIISHEGHWGPHMIEAYKKELSSFQVAVVVCYRRWFEWIPSMYWQNNKRKLGHDVLGSKDGKYIDKIIPFLRQQMNRPHETHKRHLEFVDVFDDVTILNIHNVGGDLQKYFLCKVMKNTPHTCAAMMPVRSANTKGSMHYGLIAEAAFNRSLVDASKFGLHQIIKLIEDYHHNTLGLTMQELPLKCLTPKEQDHLLNVSITWERRLVPEWASAEGIEEGHRAKFVKAGNSTLCDVDTDAVLAQEKWKSFFLNISQSTI